MKVLGIDIGGTSIKGAIVFDDGHMLEPFNMPVVKNEEQYTTISKLFDAIDAYLDKVGKDIDGIGIGIPGTIDSINGIVSYSANLKWESLPVVDLFNKHYNVPTRITNDANAAAYGEASFGSGKKYENVIMLTLGTGVGSGLILNGKLYEGMGGKAGELGHTTLIMDGEPCGCGRRGCVEAYASATGLKRMIEQAMKEDKQSLLWEEYKNAGTITSKIVFDAAKRGDFTANRVVDDYIHYLGEAILNFCNIFRPNCIVLSGGIAKQGEYLNEKLRKYCEKYEYGYPRSEPTEIVTAELGYNSGMIGAACLILKK